MILLSSAKTQKDRKARKAQLFLWEEELKVFSTSSNLEAVNKLYDEEKHLRSILKDSLQKQLPSFQAYESRASLDKIAREQGLPALFLYDGLVNKQLKVETWTLDTKHFARRNLYYLSAYYGFLRADQYIFPYRLDFQMAGQKLVHYWQERWQEEVAGYSKKNFLHEEKNAAVFCLASEEFSQVFSKPWRETIPWIDFSFYKNIEEAKQGKKGHSTLLKKGRGEVANFLLEQQVHTLQDLELWRKKKAHLFQTSSFVYAADLSNPQNLVFLLR